MDFDETPEERSFRAEAIEFLEAHEAEVPGHDLAAFATDEPEAARAHVDRGRRWQRIKHDHGWAGLTWPIEHGGRGLSSILAGIFAQEEKARVDAAGVFAVGIGMVGPTLIAHGTTEQQRRFLPALLRGDEVWCQLFSEPNAGSDLAGLRTTAVRDGDEWVVNGQKVWTSGAQHSEWGVLLTRTDLDAPKHRGITYFLVDMRTSGIEVRPLRQATGASHFNEVFFDDVRVPHENILGQPNAGWGPILTTLANERSLIGGGSARTGTTELMSLAERADLLADRCVRQDLARAHTRAELLRYLGYRVRTAASRGVMPGPESSVMKLAMSHHLAATADLVMALNGVAGTLAGADAIDHGRWQVEFVAQWASRIGGGTDEIQRNTIGEKVLGLPSEPRLDKGVAFRDIPT
ncbi:MAG: acyl-CoA dehydrogenase family protein [Acidimicrobiia bacterium]|nr:acyl-CoA dehydrogenase family protein [Acidimicrobiia bacterium]